MVLRNPYSRSAGTPTAGSCPPVMVVEDDESLRSLLAHYLRGEGYAVEEVADGAAALRALAARRAAGDPPGVVLLDLMLPRVSGLTVLERLAAVGAQSMLFKPFDLEQLLPVVARYCEMSPAPMAPGE